ncbi:MAG: TIGR00730 family Rossman fold protein [Dinoroseobacter sp.]|nr:TIGR00730 family Rossman fold protein [Dinoroseobacter sp.]
MASICVYCGSRFGADPAYKADAEALGTWIARSGHQLVYGAGDVGLMGAVANATQAAGGETFGVIPGHLLEREVGKRDLSRFVVTETMHERKKVMFMNSDAIVVLPGGAGSLDEFFEVLTWRQLGLHTKPMYLLDTNGYWEPLDGLVKHVVSNGFADASLLSFYTKLSTVASLTGALKDALGSTGSTPDKF